MKKIENKGGKLMGIICPNCGKESIDEEKCAYCKYPLKKRENPFDMEKYQYLKEEYLKTNNKAAVIKNGMKHFGMSMKETKEIVDFIADEIYEAENVHSKEKVEFLLDEDESQEVKEERDNYNRRIKERQRNQRIFFSIMAAVSGCLLIITHLKLESRIPVMICLGGFLVSMLGYGQALIRRRPKLRYQYTFSFKEYFVHALLFQIIAGVMLTWSILIFRDYGITVEYPVVVFVWYILELFFILYVLGQIASNCNNIFSLEPGKYRYSSKTPRIARAKKNRDRNERIYVHYEIQTITRIEEHFNYFVIYGTILKIERVNATSTDFGKGKSRHLKKLKVPKYFHDNEKIIETLKKRVR